MYQRGETGEPEQVDRVAERPRIRRIIVDRWDRVPYSAQQAAMQDIEAVALHALREFLWALGAPSDLSVTPTFEFDGLDLLVEWP